MKTILLLLLGLPVLSHASPVDDITIANGQISAAAGQEATSLAILVEDYERSIRTYLASHKDVYKLKAKQAALESPKEKQDLQELIDARMKLVDVAEAKMETLRKAIGVSTLQHLRNQPGFEKMLNAYLANTKSNTEYIRDSQVLNGKPQGMVKLHPVQLEKITNQASENAEMLHEVLTEKYLYPTMIAGEKTARIMKFTGKALGPVALALLAGASAASAAEVVQVPIEDQQMRDRLEQLTQEQDTGRTPATGLSGK